MINELNDDIIKKLCNELDIYYGSDGLPSISEMREKLQNTILDQTSLQLNKHEYTLVEQAFIYGVIYGANFKNKK